MGEPFEGSEGGESPDREDESLEAFRNRLRTKYPEAEPRDQGVSPMAEWEDGRLDVRESPDEKERENELEILRKEIIEKYPSAEEHSPQSGPNQEFEKDRDNLSIDETQKSDSSKQRLQDSAVDSGDRDREHEEERSRVESKLELDPPGRHEIERGSTSIAREYQPGTDNVAQQVDSPTSAGRELVNGAQELRAEPAGHSRVPEERFDLKVPDADAKEVRDRHVIESTLQGEGKGRPTFAIRKDVIEDAIGEKMEKGKEHEISVWIEGIGGFKIRHVERGEGRIFISLPKEGRPENLRFGEKHRIEICSVEERRNFNVIDTKEAGPRGQNLPHFAGKLGIWRGEYRTERKANLRFGV